MRHFIILTFLLAGILGLSACMPMPETPMKPATPEPPPAVLATSEPPTAVPAEPAPATAVPGASVPPMSIKEALQIAAASECAQAGQLTAPMIYNENTGTWWIDLTAEKPGCNPACVVDVNTKTAEVNWRCTGLAQPTGSSQIANPASANCQEQGGAWSAETGPGGGQFGVCTFSDGKQCEEWAMYRGDCPVGGVDVTGYATEAGRYCAITGGTYAATAQQGTAEEQGTCTLKSGKVCDAAEYYAGECTAE